MNRKAVLFAPLLFGLLFHFAWGCGGPPPLETNAVPEVKVVAAEPTEQDSPIEPEPEKTFLWRATSPGGEGKG